MDYIFWMEIKIAEGFYGVEKIRRIIKNNI